MPYVHWEYVAEDRNPATQDSDTVHHRRTLDEAGYPYASIEDLRKRDFDQVMTRHSDNDVRMMVDQLWIWVLDECKCVLTNSAQMPV